MKSLSATQVVLIPRDTFYHPELRIELAALNRTVTLHQGAYINRFEPRPNKTRYRSTQTDRFDHFSEYDPQDGQLWLTGKDTIEFNNIE